METLSLRCRKKKKPLIVFNSQCDCCHMLLLCMIRESTLPSVRWKLKSSVSMHSGDFMEGESPARTPSELLAKLNHVKDRFNFVRENGSESSSTRGDQGPGSQALFCVTVCFLQASLCFSPGCRGTHSSSRV